MKKIIFILVFFAFLTESKAQVFANNLYGYSGEAYIPFQNGYYQGKVVNGIAHGNGVYYYRDGTFMKGNYQNGYLTGDAILVTQYGYISGCAQNGVLYQTPCENSRSYSDNYVQNTVSNVYNDRPSNNQFTNKSPEGYDIKRIEPNSQMGRTLLGRYSGN